MGDLKVSEGFLDAIMIRKNSNDTAGTGLTVSCTVMKLSDGTTTALTVAELTLGVYKVTDWTPAADTEYITIWAVVEAGYTIHVAYKLFKVGGGRTEDIYDFVYRMHADVTILFIIPEALGAISADNTAIQEQLDILGTVVTVTQADALAYPDYQMMNLVVIGTDLGVAAWNTANLADLKAYPGAPILFCDVTPAAYFEMGTDGGDAAAKTDIVGVANIEASLLGFGYKGTTGLAVGANAVAAAATFQTLDMSDADITETYYAHESVAANTDVVLGLIRKVQLDGTRGMDEEGLEVNATLAFYGAAYSADDLNTLGLAVLHHLGHMLTMESTIGPITDLEDIEKRLFGNVRGKLSNTVPLAAFLVGNSGGVGTELPNGVSLYDVVKALSYLAGTGAPTIDSFLDYIMNKDAGQTYDRATDSLEMLHEDNTVPAADSVTNTLIKFVVGNKSDTAAAVINATNSLMRYMKMLVTDWLNGGRLDLILDGIAADVDDTKTGKSQVLAVSITAALNAGITAVATVGTAPVIIDSIVLHADTGAHADMTSCAIEGGVGQVVEFISAAVAIEANLDAADKQVSWGGPPVRLAVGKIIYIDLQGVGANAADLTVTITYHAETDGGVLA